MIGIVEAENAMCPADAIPGKIKRTAEPPLFWPIVRRPPCPVIHSPARGAVPLESYMIRS
jgi:hypothetical protein